MKNLGLGKFRAEVEQEETLAGSVWILSFPDSAKGYFRPHLHIARVKRKSSE